MSVTFMLDHSYNIETKLSGDPTESELDAYFEERASWGEFNVANGNAAYIIRDLLGLSIEDGLWGGMDGDAFRFRLSQLSEMDVVGGIAPTEKGRNFVSFGRTVDQCERYLRALVKLAKLSERHECGITWG